MRRRDLLPLALVLAVAFALRRWGWDNWSLWLDEAMQVDYAGGSLRRLLDRLLFDGAHPPLGYLPTFAVLRAFTSDAALRWPSLVFGALTSVFVYIAAGGRARGASAFGAAAFCAVLPLAVVHGQEVRPYGLALCLVAASEAAWRRLHETGRRGWGVAYALSSCAAALTLYFAIFPLAAGWLVRGLKARRERNPERLRSVLLASTLTVTCLGAWLFLARGGLGRTPEGGAPRVTVRLLAEFATGLVADTRPSTRFGVAAGIAALALLGLASTEREERPAQVAMLLAAIAGPLAVLVARDHWWELRYALLATVPLARLFGEGIGNLLERLPGRLRAAAGAVLALGLLAAELGPLTANARSGREDWRGPARFLASEEAQGRGGSIVAAEGWSFFALSAQLGRSRAGSGSPLVTLAPVQPEAFRALVGGTAAGWIARTPHSAVNPIVNDLLSSVSPSAMFPRADGVRLYRVERGALVDAVGPLGALARASVSPVASRIPAATLATAAGTLVFPGAASAMGLGGVRYETELRVANLVGVPTGILLAALTAKGPSAVFQLSLPAWSTYATADVLAALGTEGSGALVVAPVGNGPMPEVQATTWARASGRTAVTLPAIAAARALGSADAVALGLGVSRSTRSNVGVVNLGSTEVAVEVRVAAGGRVVERVVLILPPLASVQRGLVGEVEDAVAVFRLLTPAPDARLVRYAVEVDNRTNDGRFVLAVTPPR